MKESGVRFAYAGALHPIAEEEGVAKYIDRLRLAEKLFDEAQGNPYDCDLEYEETGVRTTCRKKERDEESQEDDGTDEPVFQLPLQELVMSAFEGIGNGMEEILKALVVPHAVVGAGGVPHAFSEEDIVVVVLNAHHRTAPLVVAGFFGLDFLRRKVAELLQARMVRKEDSCGED